MATSRGAPAGTARRIAVVIPAFNEAGHVGHVVHSIPRDLVNDIIVVDDHSTDGTAKESRQNGALHVTSCPSHGVGAAIKTGYAAALERGAEIVVVVAGDGQHDPYEIPILIGPILEGTADYVVGDRLTGCQVGRRMRPFRYVGNRLLSLLTHCVVGYEVRDSQCGFTAATREALQEFDMKWISDIWGVPNDFLVECKRLGLRVEYVKVSALLGFRESYIKITSYVPRMTFILGRGALRLLRARSRISNGTATAEHAEGSHSELA